MYEFKDHGNRFIMYEGWHHHYIKFDTYGKVQKVVISQGKIGQFLFILPLIFILTKKYFSHYPTILSKYLGNFDFLATPFQI